VDSNTSPVAISLEDSMAMLFGLPKKFTKESLPQQNQVKIECREEPVKTLAAISFGGWANDAKTETYQEKLKTC